MKVQNTPVDGDVPEGGENIETQPDAPRLNPVFPKPVMKWGRACPV